MRSEMEKRKISLNLEINVDKENTWANLNLSFLGERKCLPGHKNEEKDKSDLVSQSHNKERDLWLYLLNMTLFRDDLL